MFGFLKKENRGIAAPITGICKNITEVADKVFSSKAMGDGFAVLPSGNIVVAPVTGEIAMIFPINHAFGMKTKEGTELLVHIGIDTVSLNGEGFTALVKQGDRVKAGTPVIRVEREKLMEKGVDLTTMVIFTEGYNRPVQLECYGKQVEAGEILIQD